MATSLPDPAATLEISVHRLDGLWTLPKAERPLLIDCREQNEWDYCRIGGARLIPLSQWTHGAPTIDVPPGGIVIYCHHGVRSLHATQMLRKGREIAVFSLAGGIDAWSRQINPSIPLY